MVAGTPPFHHDDVPIKAIWTGVHYEHDSARLTKRSIVVFLARAQDLLMDAYKLNGPFSFVGSTGAGED